jgi:uncharacterized short protein YbdD (DUF466 family)
MSWRGVWRLLRDLSGDSAYERYLTRHRSRHPDVPPLPEAEFWRRRTDSHRPRTCC